MAARPIQAKDITTDRFLDAARADRAEGWESPAPGGGTTTYHHSTAYSVAARLGLPVKVVMAKITKLDHQGVIEGCGCGCSSPIWIIDEEW